MADALKYLYSQFILRDVLSCITPGAIVILTSLFLYWPGLLMNNALAWPLYIPLFGLFYVTGFAIECLERLSGFIRLHTLDNASFSQRLSIFSGNQGTKTDIYKDFREAAIEFLRMSKNQDWAQQDYERKIVLKQMCAGNVGAIAIAVLLLAISYIPWPWLRLIGVGFILLLLLVSLFWGYRDFTIAATTTEKKIGVLNREGQLSDDK